MKLLYSILLILSFQVSAAQVIDIDETMPDALIYIKWNNGGESCIRFPTQTGVRFDTPAAQPGETLQQYLARSWAYEAPSVALKARCDAMAAKFSDNWTVAPLTINERVYDRPVYALAGFPDSRVKIGAVKAGASCGPFVAALSARIKALTWRQVTVGSVTGVVVCKK